MRPNILDPLNPQSPGFGERLQEGSRKDTEDFQQHVNDVQERYNSFPINSRISKNIAGNYIGGPPPYNPDNFSDLVHSREQWSQDPYSYGKPISFGAGERDMDFEKYYSRSEFKNLGFSLSRDNEAVYNKASSWISDFGRAIPQIIKLAGIGFRDMETEWTDWGGKPDVKHAAEMQRAIKMGTTSRGGVGGWIQNFALNSAYTMGVMAALVGEELAITGATSLTGGLDLPATGPLAVARGTTAASKIGSFAKAIRTWAEAFKAIRTPEQATAFYKAATATGKFFNPLERTLEFATEFSKLNGMKNYAKASRGAMELFGDIRTMYATTSESKLEGGFQKNETNKELVDQFYKDHNRLPDETDAKHINEISDKAANWTTMSNVPLIYLTNKIVFDKAFKGFKVLRESGAKKAADETAGKLGKVLSEGQLVSKYSKAGVKELIRPGNLLKGTLRYTSKNLMEGLQETSQDVIHNAFADYYKQFYNDPTVSTMKASFGRGLLSQVSAQGLDTFIQGFLMGGAIGAVSTPLYTTLPLLGMKIFTPAAYGKWKTEKETYVNNFLKAYNEVRSNPKKYVDALNSTDENFVAQTLYNDYSKKISDPKTVMDLKDESAYHHVYTMLQNNQFDILKELVNDFQKMTPEQLTEVFGDPSEDNLNMTPKERLNNFNKKIDMIKTLWDDHIKTHPNPISPMEALQSEQAFKYYTEFEMYRKIALFANYSFERAADRSASILEKASINKPLSKAFSSDFTVLYSPRDLQDHLKALRQEISLLKGSTDSQSKQDLKSKENRLDVLSKYKDTAIKLQKALKNNPGEVESLNEELHKSYSEYLKTIADEYNEPLLNSKTDETFILIKDFYANHQDRIDMARAVNMFSNPDYIQELLARLHDVKSNLDNSQVDLAKDGLLVSIDRIQKDALLNELFNKGILIAENDPFVSGKAKSPSKFYNATDHSPVGPEKEAEAKEIVRIWSEQTSEAPVITPVSSQALPVAEDTELETKLRNAFTVENLRRVADREPKLIDFDEFVKTNSIAQKIIKEHSIEVPDMVDDSKLPDILAEYKNKIIWGPSGSGKTWTAERYPDVVDADDLLLNHMIKYPEFEKATRETFGKEYSSPLSWLNFIIKIRNKHKENPGSPDVEQEIYDKVGEEMKSLKTEGKTILTASEKLAKYADIILTSTNIKILTRKIVDSGKASDIQNGVLDTAKKLKIPDKTFRSNIVNELTGITPFSEEDVETIKDRVELADTLTKLNKLEKELIKEVEDDKIKSDVARKIIEDRKRQLITEVSFDRIKKDDILIMTDKTIYGDKGYGQVTKVSGTEITVRKWWAGIKPGTATEFKTITPDNINTEVSLIYDDAMTDTDITQPIDPASEQVAKNNAEDPDPDIDDMINKRLKGEKPDDDLDNPNC